MTPHFKEIQRLEITEIDVQVKEKKWHYVHTNKIGINRVSINLLLILILNLKRDTEMWRQDFQNPSHP